MQLLSKVMLSMLLVFCCAHGQIEGSLADILAGLNEDGSGGDSGDKKTTTTDKKATADDSSDNKKKDDSDAVKETSDTETDTDKDTSDTSHKDDTEVSSETKKDDDSKKDKKPDPSDKLADTDSATVKVTDVHTPGLDTISIEGSGNWLEKRIWYKKGEQLYEEIQKSVKKATDIRMQFVHEVNQIGQKIDDFYQHVTFDQGQVDQMLKDVAHELELVAQKKGDLSEHERHLKMTVQLEQKQIEKVGKDIKLIDDLDTHIDKSMMKAFKIIDECRELEVKAWKSFKGIGSEIDDQKARKLYYEMDNDHKNIEQKAIYLHTKLLPFIKTELISKVEDTMNTIKKSVKELESKGVHLQDLIKQYEAQDIKTMHEREKTHEKEAEQVWEKKEEEKEKQAQQDVLKQEKEAVAHHGVTSESDDVGTAQSKDFEQMVKDEVKHIEQEVSSEIEKAEKTFAKKEKEAKHLLKDQWWFKDYVCPVWFKVKGLICTMYNYTKPFWDYTYSLGETLGCYLECLWCKTKCLICAVRTWICQLFGYG